mmetsp:Transcript_23216/g.26681  ORF Transcript_23216/g.26681 Transcript_23216/m.26681 type:complete len:118 (-) Transcript_23216:682-1035(-)
MKVLFSCGMKICFRSAVGTKSTKRSNICMIEDLKGDGFCLCFLFLGGTNSNPNQNPRKLGCKRTIFGLGTVEGIPEQLCLGCRHFWIGMLECKKFQTCAAVSVYPPPTRLPMTNETC